jgi:glycosyltransferase involved in cell wall biosynthesis
MRYLSPGTYYSAPGHRRRFLEVGVGSERKARLFDLAFVISPNNRGWILEGICQEIARYFPGSFTMHYGLAPLPKAQAYFFSHWSLFTAGLRQKMSVEGSTTLVWFTHPPSLGRFRMGRLVRALNRATRVVSTSSVHAEWLITLGLEKAKVEVVLPGADPALFLPHDRGDGAVGLCSAYYPRKSPELIVEIVQRMPDRPFLLLGRGWEQAPEYTELQTFGNFTYVQAPYEQYPQYYRKMDVFLSPSRLEGGPIPLLEAMMCNAVPVATRTGFAPDLIEHGSNGFLYEPDTDAETACALIEQAYGIDADVRKTVEHLTWERFSRTIQMLL